LIFFDGIRDETQKRAWAGIIDLNVCDGDIVRVVDLSGISIR
jgi:hypothetical protein